MLVPAAKRSVAGLNLVRNITIADGKVSLTLASTGLIPGAQDWIKDKVIKAAGALSGVGEVEVTYVAGNEILFRERNNKTNDIRI